MQTELIRNWGRAQLLRFIILRCNGCRNIWERNCRDGKLNSFRDCVKDITEQRGQRQPRQGRSRRNCRWSPQLGQHCLLSCLSSEDRASEVCGNRMEQNQDASGWRCLWQESRLWPGPQKKWKVAGISHLFPSPGHLVSGRDSYMNEG